MLSLKNIELFLLGICFLRDHTFSLLPNNQPLADLRSCQTAAVQVLLTSKQTVLTRLGGNADGKIPRCYSDVFVFILFFSFFALDVVHQLANEAEIMVAGTSTTACVRGGGYSRGTVVVSRELMDTLRLCGCASVRDHNNQLLACLNNHPVFHPSEKLSPDTDNHGFLQY